MRARKQLKSDKYPYESPTTPGLHVTVRAYIIELICLNIDNKLGPRFWSDTRYWGPKFRRETKGVANICKQLDLDDKLIQTSLVQIIKERNVKSLTRKTTVNTVAKQTQKRKEELQDQRNNIQKNIPKQEIDTKKNSTFIDTGNKSVLAKVREMENG